MSDRMPALFLSHGSPMLALEDEPTTRFLRRLPTTLPEAFRHRGGLGPLGNG
jgi:aromatic ring-opening dioxygenase catalytic subunit (LigB family)